MFSLLVKLLNYSIGQVFVYTCWYNFIIFRYLFAINTDSDMFLHYFIAANAVDIKDKIHMLHSFVLLFYGLNMKISCWFICWRIQKAWLKSNFNFESVIDVNMVYADSPFITRTLWFKFEAIIRNKFEYHWFSRNGFL